MSRNVSQLERSQRAPAPGNTLVTGLKYVQNSRHETCTQAPPLFSAANRRAAADDNGTRASATQVKLVATLFSSNRAIYILCFYGNMDSVQWWITMLWPRHRQQPKSGRFLHISLCVIISRTATINNRRLTSHNPSCKQRYVIIADNVNQTDTNQWRIVGYSVSKPAPVWSCLIV